MGSAAFGCFSQTRVRDSVGRYSMSFPIQAAAQFLYFGSVSISGAHSTGTP